MNPTALLAMVTPYAWLAKIVGVAALAIGLFGGGMWLEHRIDSTALANCQAARSADNARANATAVSDIAKSQGVANVQNDDASKKIAAVHAASNATMEKVNALPDDHALTRSPVLRTYLDGLRQHP